MKLARLFLAAAVTLSILGPTATTYGASEEEAGQTAVQQYAKAYGVDVEVATAALAFQTEGGLLVDELANKYPTIYADAAFTNGEAYSLTVYVKQGADWTPILEVISSAGWSSELAVGRIELAGVPYSHLELEAFAADWASRLDIPEAEGVMSVLDSRGGVVTVQIPGEDPVHATQLVEWIEGQVGGAGEGISLFTGVAECHAFHSRAS